MELSRAKNQLKSSLLMNLESRPILFEDIGRQVLTYGARTPAADLVRQIESVTAADLNKVARALERWLAPALANPHPSQL